MVDAVAVVPLVAPDEDVPEVFSFVPVVPFVSPVLVVATCTLLVVVFVLLLLVLLVFFVVVVLVFILL